MSSVSSNANENLSPAVLGSISKELRQLVKTPPHDNICLVINDDLLTDVQADLSGPPGTPYAGGTFRVRLVLGPNYPNEPPKGYFVTRIFHANISPTGEICVNALKKDWSPNLGLNKILLIIYCLLVEPYAESALNQEAAKLQLENYAEFERKAALFTRIHAMGDGGLSNAASDMSDMADDSTTKKAKKDKDKVTDKKALEKKKSLKRL